MGFLITLLLLTVSAFGQRSNPTTGSIHGVVTDEAGQPANEVQIAAVWICQNSQGCPLSMGHAITNSTGEFGFSSLGLGKWEVFVDDREAGYVGFGADLSPPGMSEKAEITSEHPDAEVHISLPPKAGFMDIHLTDKMTGTAIPMVSVRLALAEHPDQQLFKQTINQSLCGSAHFAHFGCSFLVPPDTAVLVHVWADGYREWNETAGGAGKALRLRSGDHAKWDIQLEPLTARPE
jgi:hypothetical protein